MKTTGLNFPVYVLTARLENRLYWSQALFYPEVARLAGRPPLPPLLGSLKKELEVSDLSVIRFRQFSPAIEIEKFTVTLQPRRRSYLWEQPFHLEVYALVYPIPETMGLAEASKGGPPGWTAYLPQWNLQVVAPQREALPAAIQLELELWQQRQRNAAVACQSLLLRQRWVSLSGSQEQLAVIHKTQKSQDSVDSILPQLTARLHDRPLASALEMHEPLARLAELLQGEAPQSVLLVGPPGCGKSALVYELVRRRANFSLGATPFYESSGARLLFGDISLGAWQERCRRLINELTQARAIVHLGNLRELLEAGRHASEPFGVAGFLRPYLAGGQLLATLEATPEQLAYVEREYPQLLECFVRLELESMAPASTLKVLKGLYPWLPESVHKTVLELHERFTSAEASPGWPVRFLRSVVHQGSPSRARALSKFSHHYGLPLVFLDEHREFEPETVRAWFSQRLLGQEEAIASVVNRLAAFKAGLTRPHRPIASLLLIGPTGTGKTELARCLAEFVFQDRTRLTRFDMSEYSDPWSVARLIGTGSQGQGLLVARVRERPFQVVLFDELEKAHPDFFDLLLQILGDARLSDGSGQTADFSNCIVLMTSNLGADRFVQGSLGLRASSAHDTAFLDAVRAAMRPELLNRIDEIIPFRPLSPEIVLQLCRDELSRLPMRDGLRQRRIQPTFGVGVAELLARLGYERRYGARPLKRTLDRLLLAPLAEALGAHPLQIPLRIHIEVVGDGALRVHAFPQTTAEAAAALEQQIRRGNEEISKLRRRLRSLEKGPALTQLRNEEARAGRRRRDPAVYVQPTRYGELLRQVGELSPRIEELEELALGALSDPQLFEQLPQQTKLLQGQLEETIIETYCLLSEDPHTMLVGIYSESPEALARLAATYGELLVRLKARFSVQQIKVRKGNPPPPPGDEPKVAEAILKLLPAESQPVWCDEMWTLTPQLERHALDVEKFLLHPESLAAQGVGLIFAVQARNIHPLLRQEAGLHVIVEGGKQLRCLVETSQKKLAAGPKEFPYAPPSYQLPADLHRKNSIVHSHTCRTYQVDERVAVDAVVGSVPWGGRDHWASRLLPILEKRLARCAEAAVLLS